VTEHDRLAYLAACEALAVSAVPAPSPQPVPETHEQAIVTAHEGSPTVAVQDRTHGAGIPALDKGGTP
jgi:hypothetical protein